MPDVCIASVYSLRRRACTSRLSMPAPPESAGARCIDGLPAAFLYPGLVGVQLEVPAFLLDKLFVMALLTDASVFYYEDLIGLSYGAEPVGDNEGCAPLHKVFEALLDERFRLGVEV